MRTDAPHAGRGRVAVETPKAKCYPGAIAETIARAAHRPAARRRSAASRAAAVEKHVAEVNPPCPARAPHPHHPTAFIASRIAGIEALVPVQNSKDLAP